jgi:hypothetical protein
VRGRAATSAAKANLRAALPAAELDDADEHTYAGMDVAALRAIDPGPSTTLGVVSAAGSSSCLTDSTAGETWSVQGPGAPLAVSFPNATCS